MSDFESKLAKVAAEQLERCETVVAATKCVPRGGIRRRMVGGGFGAIGVAVAGAVRPPDSHAIAGERLPKLLAVALTERRLFVFSLSQMTGRASTVHTVVPLTQVGGVDAAVGRTIGIKQLDLTVSFIDGSSLSLEVPRAHISAGRRFADALAIAARASSRPAPPPGGRGAADPSPSPPSLLTNWEPSP